MQFAPKRRRLNNREQSLSLLLLLLLLCVSPSVIYNNLFSFLTPDKQIDARNNNNNNRKNGVINSKDMRVFV